MVSGRDEFYTICTDFITLSKIQFLFYCENCGSCCKDIGMKRTPYNKEELSIARFLKTDIKSFSDEYLKNIGGGR